jgi:hypothetical protein
MAPNVTEILRRFKGNVAKILSAETINRICIALGHDWRERVLTSTVTLQVFLLQILHGNIACSAMARLAGLSFSAQAYCTARLRLPLDVFAVLLQRVCDALIPEIEETGRSGPAATKLLGEQGLPTENRRSTRSHGVSSRCCPFRDVASIAIA